MNVIAFVGMPGSGKSVAGNYFKEKGFYLLYFGQLVLDEVKRRGLDINPTNEKMVREDIRKIHGMAACAHLSVPIIKQILSNNQKICIDGLYSFSEYKLLKELLGDTLSVVAISCEKKTRYQRLAQRQIRPLTPKEAEQRDIAEIENLEKGGPIAIADFTLLNDGSKNDLLTKLAQLERKIFG